VVGRDLKKRGLNLLAKKKSDDRGGGKTVLDPLLLGDVAIAISIELLEKTLDEGLEGGLLAAKSSTDTSHLVDDALDLRAVDGARVVSIKGLEQELELLAVVRRLDELKRLAELIELDSAVVVLVDELEEVLHLLRSSALHAGLKELLELLTVKSTAVVSIKSIELCLKSLKLLLGVLLAAVRARILGSVATHLMCLELSQKERK